MAKKQGKVVVRNLPRSLDEEKFYEIVKSFEGKYSWSYFRPGKSSMFPSRNRPGVAFMYFPNESDIFELLNFAENGGFALNERSFKPQIEFAPCQHLPKKSYPKDSREGRYKTDLHYMDFIDAEEEKIEILPSAELQLEEEEKRRQGKEGLEETEDIAPIVAFLQDPKNRSGRRQASKKKSKKPDLAERKAFKRTIESDKNTKDKQGRAKHEQDHSKDNKKSNKSREKRSKKSEKALSQTQSAKNGSGKKHDKSFEKRPKNKPKKGERKTTKESTHPMLLSGTVKIMKREVKEEDKAVSQSARRSNDSGDAQSSSRRRPRHQIRWNVRKKKDDGKGKGRNDEAESKAQSVENQAPNTGGGTNKSDNSSSRSGNRGRGHGNRGGRGRGRNRGRGRRSQQQRYRPKAQPSAT
mmetsp:Transcript_4597/g.6501  ORF Transcript_4597/g.6501 Transcript_4597/m.6501 type:complete len:410 (-) Transcript_4597:212-1441(-)